MFSIINYKLSANTVMLNRFLILSLAFSCIYLSCSGSSTSSLSFCPQI